MVESPWNVHFAIDGLIASNQYDMTFKDGLVLTST